MDFRILGLLVFVLIVLSGGAVIPLLGFSAVVYLLAFLVHVGFTAWQGLGGRPGDAQDRTDSRG
jgi:hypothetical protein